MNCDDVRIALEDDGPRAGPVAKHLCACADCSQYAQQLAAENQALSAALDRPVDEQRWQNARAALNRRLLNEQPRPLALQFPRRSAAAAAVACALLGGLLLYYWAAGQDPETAHAPTGDSFGAQLARLQQQVRDHQLLENLEQLQAVFTDAGDADASSAAEDAELYVERLLALDVSAPDQSREILAGIRAARIFERLQEVRQSLSDETPKPVISSLESAAATLGAAGRIAAGGGHAR